MKTLVDWNSPQAIAAREHSAALEAANDARRRWADATRKRDKDRLWADYKALDAKERELRASFLTRYA